MHKKSSRVPVSKVSQLTLAICLGLVWSVSVGAQESATSSEQQTQDEGSAAATAPKAESAVVLDDITVTAQRRVQRIQDVPVTVSALSEQTLKQAGVRAIFDLPSAVSGLSWGGAGNLTQPSIRGVSSTVSVGGAENSNALYVDGVFYSQAHLFGGSLPDVDRVEVLKGPQGTLFGRNSVGGAIRIFTREPTFYTTGSFNAEYGYFTGGKGSRSAPHHLVSGFFSAPLVDDRLAFSISAAQDSTDGWMTEQASGDRYGKLKRTNARAKLLYTPSENVRVLLNAYYLKHDDRGVQAMTPINGLVVASEWPGTVVPTRPFHTSFDVTGNTDWDDANVQSKGISALVEWTTPAGVLSSTTNTNKDEIYNRTTIHHSRGTTECVQAFACLHLDRGTANKPFSQEFNFTSSQFGRYRFTAGLFYYDSTSTGYQYANGGVNPAAPKGTLSYIHEYNLRSLAGYGELEIKATDRLTAIVGGRYAQEKRHDIQLAPTPLDRKEDFNSFLPKVSLMYALTPSMNIYGTYSVGQASGLTGISNTGSVPKYLPVQPEKNNAYEIGLKYASRTASVSVAAFYYDYTNKQEQVAVLSTPTTYAVFHVNTGPVRIYGLDLDTSFRLTDDLTLRGNLSWVPEAKYLDFPNAVGISTDRKANGQFNQVFFDATDRRLMRSPKVTGNLTLAYEKRMGEGHFGASATVFHSSRVFHDTYHVIAQPGYTTLGANAGYTWDNQIRFGIYGRNLTDEVYIFHGFASAAGFTANYAKPREIGLSVSYEF